MHFVIGALVVIGIFGAGYITHYKFGSRVQADIAKADADLTRAENNFTAAKKDITKGV